MTILSPANVVSTDILTVANPVSAVLIIPVKQRKPFFGRFSVDLLHNGRRTDEVPQLHLCSEAVAQQRDASSIYAALIHCVT